MIGNNFIVICLIFLLSNSSCKKQQSDQQSTTVKLPPFTTQGLNTFGWKVNGKIALPNRLFGDMYPYLGCYYEHIYSSPDRPYNFEVFAKADSTNGAITKVIVELDSITIHQGDTIRLGNFGQYKNYGEYFVGNLNSAIGIRNYFTTDDLGGSIVISYLDEEKNIVSGKFWFDAIDSVNNDTVHITEGIFDMKYK